MPCNSGYCEPHRGQNRMAGRGASDAQVEAIRKEWGFDRSLPEQYVTTMRKALAGKDHSIALRVLRNGELAFVGITVGQDAG